MKLNFTITPDLPRLLIPVGDTKYPKILASDNKSALKGKSMAGASMAQKNQAVKAAKAKARQAGEVVVPNDAFIQVLKG